jgi:hypothetical protein
VRGQAIEGTLEVDINRALASKLPSLPYVGSLAGLKARLTAEGTPESPAASLELAIDRLHPWQDRDDSFADYSIENIRLFGRINPEQVTLQSLEARIGNASLEASGLIVTESLLAMIQEGAFDARSFANNSEMEVVLENFKAREFAGLLPAYLRSTGTLSGAIRTHPQDGLNGHLRLQGFGVRPTLYSPSVDELALELDIKDRVMSIRKAGAIVGNSPVTIGGFLDFTNPEEPLYQISLHGQRTPLLRTTDLLLHGDLDLSLDATRQGEPAVLSGDIHLRDSVLLMDIDPMAARTSGQAVPKPPFFSIQAEPFSRWLLDIDFSGEDFLRFRSPYVKALISIQMNLTGTAANPVWVGGLFSHEGTIEFPGMRMNISRSELFMTREQPDSLQLDLNAIGQVASYVVSLRVEDSLDDPHVEFASTPDLGNTQVMQMLATGSPERSNLSSVGLYLGRGLFDPGASNSLWDRFSIEIGRDVSESSKDTLDLYYDISKRLRVHGQYDKYDAQNLNLEWEVFSR